MLTLDGSTGEGGGQIVRTALFLSLVTGTPFRVTRIRAGREKPGLKAQHVSILRLLGDMTGSREEGAHVGSPEATFHPGAMRAGSWSLDVGTAGAISLVLQTALPVMAVTPGRSELVVTGGTDVPFAPTIDWMEAAYLPYVRRLAEVRMQVERRGFAPAGGGRVRVEVVGDASHKAGLGGIRDLVRSKLGAPRIQQGKVVRVGGSSIVERGIGAGVAHRQAVAAQQVLVQFGVHPDVRGQPVEAASPGTSLTLWMEDEHGNRLAHDRLGQRGKPAEDVARLCADNLVEDWRTGATVDRHLADFVVPWVALGAGPVRIPPATAHLETNAWTSNQFLGMNAVRVDRNLVR